MWLTRKGAIDASPGRRGLVPGSMGTRSSVVTGLGNAASFHSAPHGAGRNLSRAAARRRFTTDQLAEAMTGIEWRRENAEADQIMEDAKDLVQVDHTLRQALNVEGD